MIPPPRLSFSSFHSSPLSLSFSLSLSSRLLHCAVSTTLTLTRITSHRHRPFSVMTTALTDEQRSTSNSTIEPDVEDGQVKIHNREKPVKTQTELDKEEWQEAHRLACEGNRKMYIDPKTGYSVMTELLHRRRGYCCGNACRHCPYNRENVGVPLEVKKANIEKGRQRRKEIEAKEGRPVWADDNSSDAYSD